MESKPVSRQRRWQLARKAAGKCMRCGNDRGDSGTAEFCERCREKRNAENRERYSFGGSIWMEE